eukprot:COSAG05_NODE_10322_length_571_cov_1.394068_2_plen_37_part_01
MPDQVKSDFEATVFFGDNIMLATVYSGTSSTTAAGFG